VITMAQKQYIKHLYEVEEKSLREISGTTNMCFRTVKKYAQKDDWNLPEPLPAIKPERYPVVGEFIPTIDKWLEDDRKAPRKQRHTARHIYDRLVNKSGFTGSSSSIRRYVHMKKLHMKQTPQGFLPLMHPLGYAQCDSESFTETLRAENGERHMH